MHIELSFYWKGKLFLNCLANNKKPQCNLLWRWTRTREMRDKSLVLFARVNIWLKRWDDVNAKCFARILAGTPCWCLLWWQLLVLGSWCRKSRDQYVCVMLIGFLTHSNRFNPERPTRQVITDNTSSRSAIHISLLIFLNDLSFHKSRLFIQSLLPPLLTTPLVPLSATPRSQKYYHPIISKGGLLPPHLTREITSCSRSGTDWKLIPSTPQFCNQREIRVVMREPLRMLGHDWTEQWWSWNSLCCCL